MPAAKRRRVQLYTRAVKVSAAVYDMLTSVYGKHARFSSPSVAQAVQAAFFAEMDTLAIVATGIDSLLLALIPARLDTSPAVTLIYMPHASVLGPTVDYLNSHDVVAQAWPCTLHSLAAATPTQIVVFGVQGGGLSEDADGPYQRLLDTLGGAGGVKRVLFVDVDRYAAWVPNAIAGLRAAEITTPMIYASSVISPGSNHADFSRGQTFRSPTVRPNIMYGFYEVSGDFISGVVSCIQTLVLNFLRGHDHRAIIFCEDSNGCDRIAAALGARVHTDNAGNTPDPGSALTSWLQGNQKIIVNSGSLGLLPVLNVSLVVHVLPASTLAKYHQETGRAGVGCDKAWAYTIFPSESAELHNDLVQEMTTGACIRGHLSLEMDGDEVSCRSGLNYVLCQNCAGGELRASSYRAPSSDSTLCRI